MKVKKKNTHILVDNKMPVSFVSIKYVVTGDLLITAYCNLMFVYKRDFSVKDFNSEIENLLDAYGRNWSAYTDSHLFDCSFIDGVDEKYVIGELIKLGYGSYFEHEKFK